MENFSIDEILEQAIQTENLGHEFYLNMAERFRDDEELRKLFLALAGKEIEHRNYYTCMKERFDRSAPAAVDWEEVSMYMRAFAESEFFLGNKKSLTCMDKITTVAEAVRFAIGFEKETLLYFIGLRDIAPNKAAIDAIIDEERCHIRWLSAFMAVILERAR
jgi:rubrerythrin